MVKGGWVDERMGFSSRFPMSLLCLIGIGMSCREKGIIVRLPTSGRSCRVRACIIVGVVLTSWLLKTKPEAEFRLMFPVR